MKRFPLESSCVEEAGYDEKKMTFEVKLKSGAIYQYFNVTLSEYDRFMKAESKGKVFNSIIKTHEYKRIQ